MAEQRICLKPNGFSLKQRFSKVDGQLKVLVWSGSTYTGLGFILEKKMCDGTWFNKDSFLSHLICHLRNITNKL